MPKGSPDVDNALFHTLLNPPVHKYKFSQDMEADMKTNEILYGISVRTQKEDSVRQILLQEYKDKGLI